MGCLRRDRAPARDLTVDVRQHTRSWLALAQPAHVRDAPRHVEARVAVAHAHASTRPGFTGHHERCEVVKTPGRWDDFDLHATRIRRDQASQWRQPRWMRPSASRSADVPASSVVIAAFITTSSLLVHNTLRPSAINRTH